MGVLGYWMAAYALNRTEKTLEHAMRCIIHKGLPFILSAAILLFVVCSGPGPATAQSQTEPAMVTIIQSKVRGPLSAAEPGQKEEGSRSMVIETESGPFYIIRETEVFNPAGKLISMENLSVPCEASIVYQPLRRNDKNALRIEVKKVLAGATKKWAKQQPQ